MKPETKCLDGIEDHYNTEYALIKDIHYRKGEILKLEHINAKHGREIERLNARISTILETTLDISDESQDADSDDQIDRISELKDLFEYLKYLLLHFSREEGNAPINPDDIDVKYIEAASRYCYPVLFDKYAVLDQDDTTKLKIQFAEYILRMFGLENMYEYENLHTLGEIELEFIDHRSDADENAEDHHKIELPDSHHKIELPDSILHKFGIETIEKYEELIERGDIDIATVDNRIPSKDVGYGTVSKNIDNQKVYKVLN